MSRVRISERIRLWLSVSVVIFMAGVIFTYARWLAYDPYPSAASDLDVPLLFGRGETAWEHLIADTDPGVPILCYHYFRPGLTPGRFLRVLGAVLLNMPTLPENDFWTTTVPEFDRQLRWLSESGYRTVSLSDLTAWMNGEGEIPEKAVVITFDDGDDSVARYAVPILRRYGFSGTVFMLTGRAGEQGWNDLNLLDWDTMRRLEREGVLRVESHTHRLHTKELVDGQPVPTFKGAARDSTGQIVADSRLYRDLTASRATIRRELGHDISFLAWPFGYGDATVDSVAHTLGFERLLTLRPERNAPDFERSEQEPHADGLGRYAVTARTSMRLFRKMVDHSAEADPVSN
ncbi:MAG: hypothetical protein DHS20C21_02060 [Gemmatimonadota bacterium]|nr:MAG: hypothetical protein DHS20C21_02060 [Gemmatimonadota bacterium]